jgi:hypothetical protein
VDIVKKFNTVNWTFLHDLLRHLGFSRRWINWVSCLLATPSTKIIVNGQPSQRICNAQGLRQGDPLSPLLFVLVMEALSGLFRHAERSGKFAPLCAPTIKYRMSLYADDLVIFLRPEAKDIRLARAILEFFTVVSGLHELTFGEIGVEDRSELTFEEIGVEARHPVKITVVVVTHWFPCQLVHFPCKYLGVPLSIYKLKRKDLMPLVEAVTDRLLTWKSKFMSRADRTTLTKVTLTAIPIHVSIVVEVLPWIYQEINRLRRAFIWTGTDTTKGG